MLFYKHGRPVREDNIGAKTHLHGEEDIVDRLVAHFLNEFIKQKCKKDIKGDALCYSSLS
jgi:hypothetical protein